VPPQSDTLASLVEAINRASEQMRDLAVNFNVQETPVPVITTPIQEEADYQKPVTCPCETCKLERFEGSKLRSSVIHTYDFSPAGSWKKKSAGPGDPFDYHLGVELETDAHAVTEGRGEVWSNVLPEFAADMRRPKNLWVPKRDGSVTGPEFASHPATLTYWQHHRDELEDMFRMLLHAGYRSHDNDNCGMHVNISRNAFDGPPHLFRFLTLLHANPEWSLRMSQRSRASADQWAQMDSLEDPTRRAKASHKSFGRDYPDNGHGKYQCLNTPYGQPRFEFRLPRGTLRIDRFFKNLEWTVGMIEFARDAKVKDCVPVKFMDWVWHNDLRYPDLAAFIKEKFPTKAAKAKAKAIKTNVSKDETPLEDALKPEVHTMPFDGPPYFVDDDGYRRYADGPMVGERILTGHTYTDREGVERYSLNSDEVPQVTTVRPRTRDYDGLLVYAADVVVQTEFGPRWRFGIIDTVRDSDRYRDEMGNMRFVRNGERVLTPRERRVTLRNDETTLNPFIDATYTINS
jgi:hypothetical protein